MNAVDAVTATRESNENREAVDCPVCGRLCKPGCVCYCWPTPAEDRGELDIPGWMMAIGAGELLAIRDKMRSQSIEIGMTEIIDTAAQFGSELEIATWVARDISERLGRMNMSPLELVRNLSSE